MRVHNRGERVLVLSSDEAAVVVEALDAFFRRLRPRASAAFRGVVGGRVRDEPSTADRLLLLAGRVRARAGRLLDGAHTDDGRYSGDD